MQKNGAYSLSKHNYCGICPVARLEAFGRGLARVPPRGQISLHPPLHTNGEYDRSDVDGNSGFSCEIFTHPRQSSLLHHNNQLSFINNQFLHLPIPPVITAFLYQPLPLSIVLGHFLLVFFTSRQPRPLQMIIRQPQLHPPALRYLFRLLQIPPCFVPLPLIPI
jgi:hypothetical protein